MDSNPKSDLVEAWQGIQARLSEARPSRRQGTSKSFAEYAWDTFAPREIVTNLAAPGDWYFAHKDILYDGFCAWVADPGSATLPKHAMVLRTALHLEGGRESWARSIQKNWAPRRCVDPHLPRRSRIF